MKETIKISNCGQHKKVDVEKDQFIAIGTCFPNKKGGPLESAIIEISRLGETPTATCVSLDCPHRQKSG